MTSPRQAANRMMQTTLDVLHERVTPAEANAEMRRIKAELRGESRPIVPTESATPTAADVCRLPCWGCGRQVEMPPSTRAVLVVTRQLPVCGACRGRKALDPYRGQAALFARLLATPTDVEALGTYTPEEFGRNFDRAGAELTIEEIAAAAGTTVLDLPKHRGKTIAAVEPVDRSYLEWMYSSADRITAETKAALRDHLWPAKPDPWQPLSPPPRPRQEESPAKKKMREASEMLQAAERGAPGAAQEAERLSLEAIHAALNAPPEGEPTPRKTKAQLEVELAQARSAVDVAVSRRREAEDETGKLREREQELRDRLKAERGTRIKLDLIRTDGGTQMRASIDPGIVDEYAEALAREVALPPVVVFRDEEGNHWLADGFQRVAAARKAGRANVHADIREGTQRDALLYAAGANSEHGARRTSADKRMAVRTLLQDAEWRQWSNREIARRCKVDDKTVAAVRSELSADFPQMRGESTPAASGSRCQIQGATAPEPSAASPPPRKVRRRGQTYEMDTRGIGGKAAKRGKAPATETPPESEAMALLHRGWELATVAERAAVVRDWWGQATPEERAEFMAWTKAGEN